MLEGVTAHLVVGVLRSAPGNLAHKLIQLTESIRPLAVRADVPELPAVQLSKVHVLCCPFHDASGGTSDDIDMLDTYALQGDSVFGASMWQQSPEISDTNL